ncbi:hypothetical protein ACFE04_019032 [Oxalis oulophora]
MCSMCKTYNNSRKGGNLVRGLSVDSVHLFLTLFSVLFCDSWDNGNRDYILWLPTCSLPAAPPLPNSVSDLVRLLLQCLWPATSNRLLILFFAFFLPALITFFRKKRLHTL